MMLELNNYYIQELENLTDLFTNIFVIIDDIYNEIIPIGIRNKRNKVLIRGTFLEGLTLAIRN